MFFNAYACSISCSSRKMRLQLKEDVDREKEETLRKLRSEVDVKTKQEEAQIRCSFSTVTSYLDDVIIK